MHFSCRSLIGHATASSWSQYWENEPDDPTLVSRLGHLFGLLNISSAQTTDDITSLGRSLITTLSENYYASDEGSVLPSLKQALATFESDLPLGTQFNLVLFTVKGQELYALVSHRCHLVIRRSQHLSRLLTPSETVVTIQGPLQDLDQIYLFTDAFESQIGWKKIKQAICAPDLKAVEENLLSELYSAPSQTDLAAAVIEVHADEDPLPVVTERPVLPVIKLESPPTLESLSAAAASVLPPALPVSPVSQPPQVHLRPTFPKVKPSFSDFVAKLFPKKSLYISPHEVGAQSRRRRLNVLLGFVLLVVLGASSYFGYQKNQLRQRQDQYQTLKTELDKKITDAKAIRSLSLDSALELARQSQVLLDQMNALDSSSSELSVYRDQIAALLKETGSADNFTPESFYDTSLIVNQPHYSHLLAFSDYLYLYDPTSGRIDSLSFDKSTKVISHTDKIKSFTNLLVDDGKFYVWNNGGIYQAGIDDLTTKLDFSTLDSPISPISLQVWNGIFYLLTSDTILKVTPNSSGLSKPTDWLKNNQKLPDNPVSMAINGKIWVLSQSGSLVPFSRGIKDEFKAPSLSVSLTSHLVTSLDRDLLAFTDAQNTIYILSKQGNFPPSRYNLGSKKVLSLAYYEKGNALYFLCDDQKIYRIKL